MPAANTVTTIPWNLAWDQWLALFVLCIVLIIQAYIDLTQLRVPNWLTFPTILLGWLYAIVRGYMATAPDIPPVEMTILPFGPDFTASAPWAAALHGLWCSFKLTFMGIGFPLLLLFYAIGGMGAGDVKMQMGFGAWVAPIFGYALGWNIVFYSFCFAALVGGVISLIMIYWQGSLSKNKENVKAIVGDWLKAKSVQEVGEKALARKPTLQLLPYGVPLCIGFLLYMLLDFFGVWTQLWLQTARLWS